MAAAADQDWRDFRARLVERERNAGAGGVLEQEDFGKEQKGWAYKMPLIETGSVLLSTPGDHFALQQQYFHKAIILIVRHTEKGDMGVILNRPTALQSGDLALDLGDPFPDSILKFLGLPTGTDRWNVWFGGDCYGLGDDGMVCSCLHTSERLAADSEKIIKGVYIIELARARELVSAGFAEKEEFLLLAGYCGWGPGQLQEELDRGTSWTMVAADQQALLGELREAQASLTSKLSSARNRQLKGGDRVSVADMGDGTADWQRLVDALGPQAKSQGPSDAEIQADDMLRRWMQHRLLSDPQPTSISPWREGELWAGSVLRGSATSWLLGAPAALMQEDVWRMRPAQYLHRAVLLLIRDYDPQKPSSLVLLNGPKIGTLPGNSGNVFFGGPVPTPAEAGGLLAVPGGGIWGCLELPPGMLELLVRLGAFELAKGYTPHHATAVPAEERWAAVGGTISSVRDALTSAQGDAQRKRWYKTFLGLDMDAA